MATAGAGRLVIVGTPIGHLGDLSPRAADALATADLVLCEDTRVTGRLLAHVGARQPTWAVHAHNEDAQVAGVLDRLAQGQTVALASDAGLPCLSDPGARLVEAARAAGHAVTVVPGPFAAAIALAGSGLAAVPFSFWGFLPKKSAERRARLRSVLRPDPGGGAMTHAFYVPGRDLRAVLADIGAEAPTARVAMGRELTKLHEQWAVGTASDVAGELTDETERGEAVVLVEVATAPVAVQVPALDLDALVRRALGDGERAKRAVDRIAQSLGLPKRIVYAAWVQAASAAGDAGGDAP
ncbi:MAG: 16S rRNA (cytidine(1402)-2'-O)-methyltransferase [Myxococcales bacterium]|nr:16S rRNA (cytidine(1402)-2'-O)-methyltransferase [Myxococcales bacterium]